MDTDEFDDNNIPAEAAEATTDETPAEAEPSDDALTAASDEAPAEPSDPVAALEPEPSAGEEPVAPFGDDETVDEAAWQLTIPDVDPGEAVPDAVPLDEVEAGSDAPVAEDEPASPTGEEPLFELPEPDPGALAAIEASVEEIPEPGPADAPGPVRSAVPWWPYLTYIGSWLVLGIAMVVLSNRFGDPYLPESGIYPPLLLAGLLLAVLGPFTGIAGWALGRRSLSKDHRSGLLSAALLRAAAFTLGGVTLWWLSLVLVDALRLGWI